MDLSLAKYSLLLFLLIGIAQSSVLKEDVARWRNKRAIISSEVTSDSNKNIDEKKTDTVEEKSTESSIDSRKNADENVEEVIKDKKDMEEDCDEEIPKLVKRYGVGLRHIKPKIINKKADKEMKQDVITTGANGSSSVEVKNDSMTVVTSDSKSEVGIISTSDSSSSLEERKQIKTTKVDDKIKTRKIIVIIESTDDEDSGNESTVDMKLASDSDNEKLNIKDVDEVIKIIKVVKEKRNKKHKKHHSGEDDEDDLIDKRIYAEDDRDEIMMNKKRVVNKKEDELINKRREHEYDDDNRKYDNIRDRKRRIDDKYNERDYEMDNRKYEEVTHNRRHHQLSEDRYNHEKLRDSDDYYQRQEELKKLEMKTVEKSNQKLSDYYEDDC